MIVALVLTIIEFLSPGRMEIHAADVNLHAGRTTSLVFVARADTLDRKGFVVWTDLTPYVQHYMVFPWSAYRGNGSFWVTHQDMTHPGPNTGAEISASGGHAILWHGIFEVNGQQVEVNQYNYKWYPPVKVTL